MKQVYLKAKEKYFVLRNIPIDKVVLEADDLQNGVVTDAPKVELYRQETQLAIIFLWGSNRFLLTVQKESEQVNLELKKFMKDQSVQQQDYCFKWENQGASGYCGLSTVTTPKMYIYITKEHVVGLTIEETQSAQVVEEVA